MVSDLSSMSPRSFYDRVMPTRARLYVEVAYIKHKTDLGWDDEQVDRFFFLLTGFDPQKTMFAEMASQLNALDASHELGKALFVADEIVNLDGREAIDFAAGWMGARDMLNLVEINADNIDVAIQRALGGIAVVSRECFELGFRYKVDHKSE